MDAKAYVEDLVKKGRIAQEEFATFSQEKVDEAVRAIGKSIFDNADWLAKMAVEETGIGKYEHKIVKNQAKPKATWWRLKGVKSRGIINHCDEGIVEVANPIGVLGCITPTTNPTMTPVHNGMIALKGGNAIIVGAHPRSKKTTYESCMVMRKALKDIGAPEDLIQVVEEPTIEISQAIMAMCDACISTGGPGMVKAAYSSGKPAFGVGPGNVNVLVDDDVDIADVVPKVIQGRTYDNGVLCTCEQTVIIPESKYDEFVALLEEQGAFYVDDPADAEKLGKAIFPDGMIDKDMVGATPKYIAEQAGLEIPDGKLLIAVKIDKTADEGEVLAKEKLCPVLSLYKYNDFKEGADIALRNILFEGTGHSCVIHTNNKEHAEYFGTLMPTSRIGVNMVGSSGLGGAFDNGLMPTATLGCGTWGNNSVAGNLWWNHLVNISRIAYRQADMKMPTDEEVWGE